MSHASYSGQSDLDYCLECSVKHGQTSKVLMREALQRAEGADPSSEGVVEKVRKVVEELSGFEDDTNSIENENVIALNTEARDLRKFIHTSRAELGSADMEGLRQIKGRIDDLVDRTYKIREEEDICVECVAPAVCLGNEECVTFLREAASSGSRQEFNEAIEVARQKYTSPPTRGEGGAPVDISDYGASVAEKRQQLIEEIRREAGS